MAKSRNGDDMGCKNPKMQRCFQVISGAMSHCILEGCDERIDAKVSKRVHIVKLPNIPKKRQTASKIKGKEGTTRGLICSYSCCANVKPSQLGWEQIQLYAMLRQLRQKDFKEYLLGRCSVWHFKELLVAQKKMPKESRQKRDLDSHHVTDLSLKESGPPTTDLLSSLERDAQLRLTRCSEFFT